MDYALHCRFDDAEEACRNAIEVLEETFGPASPVTTTSMELLANIMRDTGRAGTVLASCISRFDVHQNSRLCCRHNAINEGLKNCCKGLIGLSNVRPLHAQ